MRATFRAFITTWGMFSVKGRSIVLAYFASLFIAAVADSFGMWAISQSITSWLENSSKSFSSSDLQLATLAVTLFLIKTVVVGIASYFCFKRLIDEELKFSKAKYIQLTQSPFEHAKDFTFSTYFDSFVQVPEVRVHTVVINSVTAIIGALNVLLVFTAVFLIQPLTALGTAVYFALIATLQQVLLSRVSLRLGKRKQEAFDQLHDELNTALTFQKLFRVMKSISFQSNLESSRQQSGLSLVNLKLLQLVPRLSLEVGLIVGAIGLAILSVWSTSIESAGAVVLVFLIAGFRIIPVVSYVQSLIATITSELPYLDVESDLLTRCSSPSPSAPEHSSLVSDWVPRLILESVSFRYPNSEQFALNTVSAVFEIGKTNVIAGAAGSGKSTLLDLSLGLYRPTSGSITYENCRKGVGYVPQETEVFDGSIRQNIALEWDESLIDDSRIASLFEISQDITVLKDVTRSNVNARQLSGGQKRLICFFRALYRDPDFLFLDEPSSALDKVSEEELNNVLSVEKKRRVIILVAHRNSTLRGADHVFLMSRGEIITNGPPAVLAETSPEFVSLLSVR